MVCISLSESEILCIENLIALPQHLIPLPAQIVLLAQVAHIEQLLAVLLQEHWLPVHVGEGRDDEEWPPGHLSVSPDAPAPDDVGRREAVCQAVQLHVVAVLSVVRGVGLPLADVGPVALGLCFVDEGVEADYELLEEAFAELAGFEFLLGPAAACLPVLFGAHVSPDGCGHLSTKLLYLGYGDKGLLAAGHCWEVKTLRNINCGGFNLYFMSGYL